MFCYYLIFDERVELGGGTWEDATVKEVEEVYDSEEDEDSIVGKGEKIVSW